MTGFPSQRVHREPPLIHYRSPRPVASRLRLLTAVDLERGRDAVRAVEAGQAVQRPVRAPGLDREMRGFIRLVIVSCIVVLLAVVGSVTVARWLAHIIWGHQFGTIQVLFPVVSLSIAAAVSRWVNVRRRHR